jgi:hypothetical protein
MISRRKFNTVVAVLLCMTILASATMSSATATPGEGSSIQTWAVIVCGGALHANMQICFDNQIAEVYRILLERKYGEDHIFYLDITYPRDVTNDGENDVDLVSSSANVQYAITNWLKSHSDSNDVCFIYLADHGDDGGKFAIDNNGDGYLNWSDPSEFLYDYEIASWVDEVECGELIIVIEACYAGDFIDDLTGPSRIIVTSTDGEHPAIQRTVYDEHGLQFENWPEFSYVFFQELAAKKSIGEAFNATFACMQISAGNQFPQLDDNGDGVGHGPIPSGGDGDLALSICWMPGDCNDDDVINILDALIVSNAYGSTCDPNWDPRADCNEDGVVDILDALIVSNAYGSQPGDPNWDPRADCNEDGVVDILDALIVSNAYGSQPGDPNWDPRADCNEDGVVDILDALIVSKAYGSTCDPNWDPRADLNCDNVIDCEDVEIVQTNFGYGY